MSWKLDKATFDSGFDPESYVGALRNYRSIVKSAMERASARGADIDALAQAAAGQAGPVRATLMTEDWCGDSACNLPILTSLFAGAGVEFRILRGSENGQMNAYYNDRGIDHIPVLSLWDGEFSELGTWVEAPAAVTTKKDAWKSERPEFMDLYRRKADDKDAAKQFAVLYRQFLEEMLAWYQSGMWDETAREVVELLK